jgi:hypothetical protein
MSASHKFYKKRRKYYPTISRFRVSSFSLFDLHKAKTLNRFILLFFVFAFMFPPLFFVFFPQSLSRHLPDLTVYMSKKGNCLPFASTWVYPRFFLWGPSCSSFSFFYVVPLCVITFRVPCCDVRCDFHMKMMFGSSLSPVVCGRMNILFAIFVLPCG